MRGDFTVCSYIIITLFLDLHFKKGVSKKG